MKIRHLCTLAFLIIAQSALAAPPNIPDVVAEVLAYHDSGQYDYELTDVMQDAEDWLKARTMESNQRVEVEKLAIVFDMDETLVSNYAIIEKYLTSGLATVTVMHNGDDFTIPFEKNMQATALMPVKRLYDLAKEQQVAVFIITGTRAAHRDYTEKKLKEIGYTDWTKIYLKPDNYKKASAATFKTETRKKITEDGYNIILNIGDQYSDLRGGFSERVYKLPNPYYFVP